MKTRMALKKEQSTGEVKYVAGVQVCAQLRVEGSFHLLLAWRSLREFNVRDDAGSVW